MAASMPASETSGYVDYFEAARLLNVTVERVRVLVSTHKLTSSKMPGTNRRYLSRAAVTAYRDARDASPHGSQPVALPDHVEQLRELVAAASGPTYDAGAEWLRNLASIAITAMMSAPGSAGLAADPKAASSSPANYMASCSRGWSPQSARYSPLC